MWRDEDEALYARLRDESVMREVVWPSLSHGSGPALHPRASGALRWVRANVEGERAVELAQLGEPAALMTLLRPSRYVGLPPAFLHHLALLEEQSLRWRGCARGAPMQRDSHEPTESSAAQEEREKHVRALAGWLALGAEGAYLAALVGAASGDALGQTEQAEIVRSAPLAILERTAARGRAGLGDGTAEMLDAVRALGTVDDAVARAGLVADHALAKRARVLAEKLRTDLVALALAPLMERFDDASGHAPTPQTLDLFRAGVEVWRRVDAHPDVERLVVEHALPIGWELYKAKDWPLLRSLNHVLREPVDAMVARVQRDPDEVAYAARAAQMLVFRAEMEPRFDDQLREAERAVATCPTHRNGRLVTADLLAQRAIRTIERAPLIGRASHLQKAAADVRRARALWDGPSITQLDEAEARLRQLGVVP